MQITRTVLKKDAKNSMKLGINMLTFADQITKKQSMVQNLGRIYLIGLPGAGKTTLGELLARALGKTFLDLDHLLQSRVGMSIPEVFTRYGEGYFREQESLMLEKVSEHDPERVAVVATGGGIVLRPDNRLRLRESGTVVYLDRSPAAILENMDVTHRPMMRKNPMRLWELNEERSPIYTECCHIRVALQGGPDESLKQLRGMLEDARKSA